MRRTVLLVLSLFASAVAGPVTARPDPRTWDEQSLVAHEWGTFTSLQGSNGVVLEGLRHEEQDLPSFVHDLRDATGITGISPKMETPVIYFYSPRERKVSVRVGFPRGVVTQWYPGASRVNHIGTFINGQPKAPTGKRIEKLANGYIHWGNHSDLTILAPGAKHTGPAVASDDPWRFSRQVDANTLRTANLNLARKIYGKQPRRVEYQYEKCLFYRGLGDFALPLQGRVHAQQATTENYVVRVTLKNTTPAEPLAHLFLVWVKDGRCGWMYVPRLEDFKQLNVRLQLAPVETSTEALVASLASKLTETGLYRKEALAMARTWQQGYFQDEGLRVLYVLPKALIDRELPLKIRHVRAAKDDRPPIEIVRTFVGRTELLSPERENELETVVRDFAVGDEKTRAGAEHTLERWGRFAIPYLHRVLAMTQDETVRKTVRERLGAMELRR